MARPRQLAFHNRETREYSRDLRSINPRKPLIIDIPGRIIGAMGEYVKHCLSGGNGCWPYRAWPGKPISQDGVFAFPQFYRKYRVRSND